MRTCALLLSLLPTAVLAAESAPAAIPDFRRSRPLAESTLLLVEGRGPVILAPAHEVGLAAAARLKAALAERLQVAPAIVTRLADAGPGQQTCIALGNLLDNELLARLYFSRYTYEDAQFPGPDGFTVHTVYDPYHWGGGRNVIVLGASRSAALTTACERFLAQLEGNGPDTALPYTLVVEPARALTPAARAALMAKPVEPSFTAFRTNAEAYLKSGDEGYARLALAALDIMVDIYGKNPTRHTPWPEETTSGDIFAAWDAFEECPLISPEKRAAYLDALFRWSRDLTKCSYEYRRIDESFTVTWNHTTFALLGLYYAGRYFDRHFHVPEAAEWLRRARLGFAAQARSWKPQEDADSYLVLTMRHVIEYSLAAWDLRFFESGRIREYADYVVACGDNRQWPAGFGDSGYSVAPAMATAALPIAFWWTRDGAYRWILDQALPKGWENPYWQDVVPQPATRFVGLNVYPIDRQIYDDIQRRPTYNEAFVRAEVPVEQAWDKISFRESWDPAGQYLLLDGIGRGKHLHFDTNGITTFVQDGERWLLDHDYLVRNTTEHSMLSVLRNGRCDALVPSLAGLAAAGETPGMAATRTFVKGYNGVDWERQVLWRKGAWFLVRDTITAREAGHYDLDVTWKTIDRQNQGVDDQGRFSARRAAVFESTGLATIDDPAASEGKALVLGEASSRLVFAAGLPAGEYEVDAIGYGVDGSSDSLYLDIDGGPTVDVHVPQQAYGQSRSTFGGSTRPRVKVATGGRHVVRIALRERPPVRLDRIEFRRADAPPVIVVAAAAPAVRPEDVPSATVSALHINPAGHVQAWVTDHVRQGISVPVSILHQRQSADLTVGDKVTFCSLVYATGPAHSGEYDVGPMAKGACQVSSPQGDTMVSFGPGSMGPWLCEAEAWLADRDGIQAVAVRDLRHGESSLTFRPAAALSLGLADGVLTVVTTAPTQVMAAGCRLDAESAQGHPGALALPPGTHVLRLKGFPVASPVLPLPTEPAAPRLTTRAPTPIPALTPLWALSLAKGQPVFRITPGDLDGDGRSELLVACAQAGYAVSANGQLLWSHGTAGKVRDVSLAQFGKAGPPTVLISSADTYLYQLGPGGAELRKDQMTGIYFSADHGERPWGLYCTRAVDSDRDGADDLLVTTLASMEAQGRSPDGAKRWRSLAAYHGCMDMAVQDLNQDGKPEIVIANKYGSVYVLRPDGTTVVASNTSIGDVTFGLGDLDGDGVTEIVHGSSTGDLVAVNLKGAVLWRFDNYGYPVERIVCADLDGDGRPEILVASGTGYLYCLGADGTRRWEQRLGLAVHDLAVLGGVVVAGTEDGYLYALDAAGKTLWTRCAGAAVAKLVAIDIGGDKVVIAGLADGRLLAATVAH